MLNFLPPTFVKLPVPLERARPEVQTEVWHRFSRFAYNHERTAVEPYRSQVTLYVREWLNGALDSDTI